MLCNISLRLQAYTDYSDSVSRRMGFIPLPLALLVSFSLYLLLLCMLYSLLCTHFTFNDVCVTFSVDQGGDKFSEDPGFTLVYVCAAVLSGVNAELFGISSTLPNVCMLHVMFVLVSLCICVCVCVQDDHFEGAQQYCSAGDVLYVCQRGQYGRKAVRSSTLCGLQPRKLQSSPHKTRSHCTAER